MTIGNIVDKTLGCSSLSVYDCFYLSWIQFFCEQIYFTCYYHAVSIDGAFENEVIII